MSRLGGRGGPAALGLAVLGLAVPALLQAQAGLQNPAAIGSLSADAGYAVPFGSGSGTEAYYRIVYDGRLVRERGTPFKRASSLDLLAPALQSAAGDVPQISLRYENSQAFAGGGLLSALGAKELPLGGLGRLGIRGTAQAGADIKLEHVVAAIGLESPPVRIPGLGRGGFSNWVVIGLNGERREATDSGGKNVNVGLATFRSFVGKAFGWRKSAEVAVTARKIVHDVLELAPTRAAALALEARLDSIPAARRTVLQQTLLDLIPEAATDDEWAAKVREMANGQADAITDQPTLAVYTEWSGWVDLAGHPTGGRFQSLFTASLDYWFLRTRDDVLLRLRYELGHERADPTVRKNQLLISLGLRL